LQNSHIGEQSPLSLVIHRYVPLRVKDDGARGGGMAMEEGEGRHKKKEKRVLNSV